MTKATENSATNSFTLKGGLYTLTTLHLQSIDLTAIEAQLAATVKQAPKYFDHTPVVIDLQAIATVADPLDLQALSTCLRTYKLVPIGLRGGNEQQRQAGFAANWALLPETQKHSEATPQAQPKAPVTTQNSSAKLITQPARSGQQIYAQGGDLVVLAPVSAGAEILADGHIHVYAPLRGRALAGVLGNTHARIFCQQLEAELISIAGHYKVSEQLKDQVSSWGKSTVISLSNEQLSIQAL